MFIFVRQTMLFCNITPCNITDLPDFAFICLMLPIPIVLLLKLTFVQSFPIFCLNLPFLPNFAYFFRFSAFWQVDHAGTANFA